MDREKVINGLRSHARREHGYGCKKCNYSECGGGCSELLAMNALALLEDYDTQLQYRDDHIAMCQAEIKRLEALQKEQEWHMLTEDDDGIIHGLPGDDGQYLMTDGKDIWIDNYVDGVDDGVWLDSDRDIREITAWMYMPELPKQDRR